jgi:hypothetical protein
MPNPTRISKSFTVKGAEIDGENQLKGAASVMGVLDQGADVIFPGFFQSALPEFAKNGFCPLAHRWDEQPVMMPTKAEERGNVLYCEATFHSTTAGQDARTVAKERLAAGLNMGLSVGFTAKDDGAAYFNTGSLLIDYAAKSGCDMSLFDVKGIRAWKSVCRGFLPGGCDTLYEYSLCSAPMNKLAGATEVKGLPKPTTKVTPRITTVVKSQYLGDIEVDATAAVLSRLNSGLQRVLWQALYSFDDESVEAMVASLSGPFDEYRDLSLKYIQALSADVPPEELREQASSYYYYYSQEEGVRGEGLGVRTDADASVIFLSSPLTPHPSPLSFLDHTQALGTASVAWIKRASWVREMRFKAGRTLSADTREKMESAHTTLMDGCTQLRTMLDYDPDDDCDPDDDSDCDEQKTIQQALIALELSLLTDEADRLLAGL